MSWECINHNHYYINKKKQWIVMFFICCLFFIYRRNIMIIIIHFKFYIIFNFCYFDLKKLFLISGFHYHHRLTKLASCVKKSAKIKNQNTGMEFRIEKCAKFKIKKEEIELPNSRTLGGKELQIPENIRSGHHHANEDEKVRKAPFIRSTILDRWLKKYPTNVTHCKSSATMLKKSESSSSE